MQATALSHHRRGSGPPLLLVHGIGSLWQFWAPVLDALAAERSVIAIDLPGFGQSPVLPPEVRPTPAALAAAVGRFLDENGLGAGDVHVAGHSLGGWVALELARQRPLRSVTAISPGGFWSEAERVAAKAMLWTAVRAARLLEPLAPAIVATAPGRMAALSGMMAKPWRMPPGVALASIRSYAAAPGYDAALEACGGPGDGFKVDPREPLDLGCPVTIAWGERDALLFPWQAKRALAGLRNARLVRLPGCGHAPVWDDPRAVARAILEGSRG